MRAKKRLYYADFETTTINAEGRVRVYLWAIVSGDIVETGDTIDTFLEYISHIKNGVIYFHNLKFDFSYIQYELIKQGIEYTLLEKAGVIYEATVYDVSIRDSLNFLPMTLREVCEQYNKIYQKTSIDYNVPWEHTASPEEREYCINDCRVLEEGLTVYYNTLEQVLTEAGATESAKKVRKKLTNAGVAYEAFKELSNFKKVCPKIKRDYYEKFKGAYHGGYVYSRPSGVVEGVQQIDVNSMYPFMYSTINMPYGPPILCMTEEDLARFDFGIIKVSICYELRPGKLPIIGGSLGRYGGINYRSSSQGLYVELVVSTTDFELIKDFYDISYSYVWGFGFETKPEMFKKYCDIFIAIKNASKGVKRNVAKIMLNSPYGKTAMNGLNEIKSYYINEDDIVTGEVTGWEIDDDAYQYLPIAIAITASARNYLLRTADAIGFDRVQYMDTDSIKYIACDVPIQFDDHLLGAWKDEGLVKYFKTIAPKKYIYYDGVMHCKCAGFNRSVIEQELKDGQEVSEHEALEIMRRFAPGLAMDCLQSSKVSGGRALLNIKKEIK